MIKTDALIIGAGPTGLFTAHQLKIIGLVINLENDKNNLLVIELFKNQKKVLIPFVKEIVPSVDIKNKFLIINPPKGLLEL